MLGETLPEADEKAALDLSLGQGVPAVGPFLVVPKRLLVFSVWSRACLSSSIPAYYARLPAV